MTILSNDFYNGTIQEDGYGLPTMKMIALDPNISASSLGVYYYITSHMYGGKTLAFPTQKVMASHLATTTKSIKTSTDLLIENGYLVMTKEKASDLGRTGNRLCNVYYLVSSLEWKDKLMERGEQAQDDYIAYMKATAERKRQRQEITRRAMK